MSTTTRTADSGQRPERYQLIGRFLGPLVFIAMLIAGQWQQTMDPLAWRAAAVGLWMAIWWATEAIPVPVTAFLPIVIFDPLGIATIRDAAAPYANPIIYLFLGGFLIARSMEAAASCSSARCSACG